MRSYHPRSHADGHESMVCRLLFSSLARLGAVVSWTLGPGRQVGAFGGGAKGGGNHIICTSAVPGGGVGADVLTNGSGGQTAPKNIHRGGLGGCLPPLAVYPGHEPTPSRNMDSQCAQRTAPSIREDLSCMGYLCSKRLWASTQAQRSFSSLHIPPSAAWSVFRSFETVISLL